MYSTILVRLKNILRDRLRFMFSIVSISHCWQREEWI